MACDLDTREQLQHQFGTSLLAKLFEYDLLLKAFSPRQHVKLLSDVEYMDKYCTYFNWDIL